MKKYFKLGVILLPIILFLFIYLPLINNLPVFGSDSAAYIVLAKSLAEGNGYRDICLLNSPPHTKYPFVWPLLLTPIIYFSGYNFLLIKLLSIIMAICSLWFIYILFKDNLGKSEVFLLMVLTGLSPQVLSFCYGGSTEIPYLFFSLLALIFVKKYKEEERWLTKIVFVSVFFLLLSYFTRSIGISLLMASLIYLFLEKERDKDFFLRIKKVILTGFLLAIPIILWTLRNSYVRGSFGITPQSAGFGDYFTELIYVNNPFNYDERTRGLLDFILRVLGNIYAYLFYAFPKNLIDIQFSQRTIIAPILTIIVFLGFLYCLIKRRTIIEYYIIFYISILFVWATSATIGARYLMPIVPIIFYYFILGIKEILRVLKMRERLNRNIFVFCITLLLFFNVIGTIRFALPSEESVGGGFFKMGEWAEENTSSDAILGSAGISSHWIYLYFNRKCSSDIPLTYNVPRIIDCIYNNKIEYVVVSPLSSMSLQYLKPAIEKNRGKFEVVYQEGENVIYKVRMNKTTN